MPTEVSARGASLLWLAASHELYMTKKQNNFTLAPFAQSEYLPKGRPD